MKTVTITLNPAFDIHCYTHNFAPYQENLASVTSRDAGGKGINISRALDALGCENTAVMVIGDENGSEFERAIEAEGIQYLKIPVSGRIRENITLHTDAQPETRISFSGFDADDSLIAAVEAAVVGELDDNSIVTFTGRAPIGISHARIIDFLFSLKKRGARLVIDSNTMSKDDIVLLKPWLIKPNGEEISKYVERTDSESDIINGARELHGAGIENVMVTLGSRGAILVSSEGAFRAVPPKIKPISTVGAGDSSIAGFISAAKYGSAEALRSAVSLGSAACLTKGTGTPSLSEFEKIKETVKVFSI